MASKTRRFAPNSLCSDCGGNHTAKWAGRAAQGMWNTLQEFTVKEVGVAARYGSVNERRGGFVDTTGLLQDLSEVPLPRHPHSDGALEFDPA